MLLTYLLSKVSIAFFFFFKVMGDYFKVRILRGYMGI